jgi:hypothetical protein
MGYSRPLIDYLCASTPRAVESFELAQTKSLGIRTLLKVFPTQGHARPHADRRAHRFQLSQWPNALSVGHLCKYQAGI